MPAHRPRAGSCLHRRICRSAVRAARARRRTRRAAPGRAARAWPGSGRRGSSRSPRRGARPRRSRRSTARQPRASRISRSRGVSSVVLRTGATARASRNRSSMDRVAPAATTWVPSATARIAASSSSGRASFSTKPLAPASIAETAASSKSKVVSTSTRGAASPRRVVQQPGRGHAVHPGHPDVHHDHVRPGLLDQPAAPGRRPPPVRPPRGPAGCRAPSRCRRGTWPGRRPARPALSRDRLRQLGAHRPDAVGRRRPRRCRRPGAPARACRPAPWPVPRRRSSLAPGCAPPDGSRRCQSSSTSTGWLRSPCLRALVSDSASSRWAVTTSELGAEARRTAVTRTSIPEARIRSQQRPHGSRERPVAPRAPRSAAQRAGRAGRRWSPAQSRR